ncbi:Cse2p NDAI_0K01730 [Naumovozyma dairenensis CBS 421]|uniref:Mediator of RNA polymerase II transcription subunit 9 n=1 Tax=Naumovozyma dairenensis (strain ATCC 10597 / BCRC 20456 / CBS 421 / NBRC 0211 / NRRL Y-12639) TaxID=1071378 RepID=G0WHV3_NAUDC|nr:hypothetical protein NDAI_0K01730 [Naumovozyma dairenensis CBS 421]CCD27364.1 hypothetical protein NDAI_0K01730 [Naumovozyma dairenensis CBS 421]
MSLQNESLKKIQSILIPQSIQSVQSTDPTISNEASAGAGSNTQVLSSSSSTSSEFVPHIFYSLYQIKKDPSSSTNQLETATGFIRHRLKNCKSLIENNNDCKKLLSKSAEDWESYLQNAELEIQGKRNVLDELKAKINSLSNDKSSQDGAAAQL